MLYLLPPIGTSWTFDSIKISQGKLITRSYVYNEYGSERYFLYDSNVDTASLKVNINVQGSSTSSAYTQSSNIVNIDNTSQVYFLEESREGFYEIKFGDGVIGKKPTVGDIITLTYLIVGPKDVNGAKSFSLATSINGNTDVSITTLTAAAGGTNRENNDSIKYNAPRLYTAQNRAVTPEDYKAILQNEFPNIQTVTVWGGEDHVPPEYGKVYVSIKPEDADALTDLEKEDVIENYLKPRNVVSITPILVDPNNVNIVLDISFKYNPNITNLGAPGLVQKIKDSITEYSNKNLQLFGGVFRASNVSSVIDASDVSIISNVMKVTMAKNITPVTGVLSEYLIDFNQKLAEVSTGSKLTSSTFTYNNHTCKLKDYYNTGRAECIIQIVNLEGLIINPNIGIVDPALGTVSLVQFSPSAVANSGILAITVRASSPDIKPTRNDILKIDVTNSPVTADIDTMATGGSTTGVNYQTSSGY